MLQNQNLILRVKPRHLSMITIIYHMYHHGQAHDICLPWSYTFETHRNDSGMWKETGPKMERKLAVRQECCLCREVGERGRREERSRTNTCSDVPWPEHMGTF